MTSPHQPQDQRDRGAGQHSDGDAAAGSVEAHGSPVIAGWQPIETAPKDGRLFIIGRDTSTHHSFSGVAHWKSGRFRDPADIPAMYWRDPTHWMPLPAPPGDA